MRTLILLGVLFLTSHPVIAQCLGPEVPEFELRVESTTVGPNPIEAICRSDVRLTSPEAVLGLSFGVSYPSPFVTLADVEMGPALELLNLGAGPDVWIVDLTPTGGLGGTVSMVTGLEPLAIGNQQRIARFVFSVSGIADGESVPLSFSCELGSPAVLTSIDSASGSVEPAKLGGEILIGGDPGCAGVPLHPAWSLHLGDAIGDPGAVVPVSLTMTNPDAVSGFSWSVGHPSPALILSAIDQGEVVLDTNGGDGPDYWGPFVDPGGGGSVGCVVSFFDPGVEVISAGSDQELALLTYQIDVSAPAAGTFPLTFGCLAGPPIVETLILDSFSEARYPSRIAGSVSVTGLTFRRGDCNSDGMFDIGDPIFLLGVLFSGGDPPLCDDACDSNDDGGRDIGDAIYILSNLFAGDPDPEPPFTSCGVDPTDDILTCGEFPACP